METKATAVCRPAKRTPPLQFRGHAKTRSLMGQSPLPKTALLTSHLSPLTSHLSPLTSHLSPLTSHLSPLTSHLSPLTSHLSPRSAFGVPGVPGASAFRAVRVTSSPLGL